MSQKIPPGGDTPRRVADSLNRVIEGRTDAYGTVTLSQGTTSTTVLAPYVSEDSTVCLSPMTSKAAGDLTKIWISQVNNGSFVIGHHNHSDPDLIYRYLWAG
jgi:hypothetical protein